MRLDHGLLALDQLGQPADEIAAPRMRIAMRVVGHRMAADFQRSRRRPARFACSPRAAGPSRTAASGCPESSMASTLPIVVTPPVAGSGPNCRPSAAR